MYIIETHFLLSLFEVHPPLNARFYKYLVSIIARRIQKQTSNMSVVSLPFRPDFTPNGRRKLVTTPISPMLPRSGSLKDEERQRKEEEKQRKALEKSQKKELQRKEKHDKKEEKKKKAEVSLIFRWFVLNANTGKET